MLQHDVIKPAASSLANVVLVKKSDGSIRFCLDLRQDSYLLPRIDACLNAVGRASHLSTLVLTSVFWQTAIDPCDIGKTALVTCRSVLMRQDCSLSR